MQKIFTSIALFLLSTCILFSQAGQLDSTFADNGILVWDVGGGGAQNGHGMAVQEDGKIVIALSTEAPEVFNFDIAVARLNVDGSIDSTFAENGIYKLYHPEFFDLAYHLELFEDNSILVVGGYGVAGNATDMILIKLDKDGNPDASFGTDGIVRYAVGGLEDYARGVAIDKEGKILIGGSTSLGGNFFRENVLCRFETTGVIDSTFGTDGIFKWGNPLHSDELWDIAIADDGNIISCGKTKPAGAYRPIIYKVLEDGSGIDSTFATNGQIIAAYQGPARDMILHSNGNILITGGNASVNGNDLFVLAYNRDGTPNTDFGIGGVFILDAAANDYGHSLIEQPDGKILVAGESGGPLFVNPTTFLTARMDENGMLDSTWAAVGYVSIEISTWMAWAHEVVLQQDGKVLVAGMAAGPETNDLGVVRFGNFIDADMDGYEMNDDCDDFNAAINPGMEETPYNGLDDDCNSATPDDDLDGDGFLFVDDCDETNPDINPDAIEIPDNDIDEDCDGNDLVGLLEKEIANQFKVYPNPTRSKIFIESAPGMPDVEFIQLHDYTGKPVKGITNTFSDSWTIDLKNLPQGLWLLSIHTKEGVVVKRIIKSNQ